MAENDSRSAYLAARKLGRKYVSEHSGDKDKRVTISLRNKGGRTCLTVRDYGEGIDPAELPHIWEKYYTSRQRNGKGVSGLGLAIVKQTAQLHHAEVSAESIPGEGSTFTFELPCTNG